MIWAISVIFILLWLLGLATAYTMGGYIHGFAIVAIALLIVGAYRGGVSAKMKSYVKARQVATDKKKIAEDELKTKKQKAA